MTKFKVFKKYNTAKEAAGGLPVIRIGDLYIAPTETDLIGFGLTSVDIIEPSNRIGSTVTMRHLDRLGNANWATPRENGGNTPSRVFPETSFR